MAQFTWTFDAPTGTYKNFTLSSRLWEAAVENSVFMDHVQAVEGYGKKQGETVTLVRVRNITEPLSADLDETVRIPEDEFTLSSRSITVKELGRAIPFTSLSDDLSMFDLENPIQRKLREQMRLVLDTKAAVAFRQAMIKYTPTGAQSYPAPGGVPIGTFNTSGTVAVPATRLMEFFDVETIRDYMFDTLQVPPLESGDYLGIFRTRGIRHLKRDPKWEEWHKYCDPQAKFNGEVGRIEGVRFIETNHANAVRNLAIISEGFIFGDEGMAMAEALTPELRAAIPGDFGRSRAVAWYGILEFGLIWDTANPGEAKVIHVTSTT
jgi:N4-gp56 family major capsid protein